MTNTATTVTLSPAEETAAFFDLHGINYRRYTDTSEKERIRLIKITHHMGKFSSQFATTDLHLNNLSAHEEKGFLDLSMVDFTTLKIKITHNNTFLQRIKGVEQVTELTFSTWGEVFNCEIFSNFSNLKIIKLATSDPNNLKILLALKKLERVHFERFLGALDSLKKLKHLSFLSIGAFLTNEITLNNFKALKSALPNCVVNCAPITKEELDSGKTWRWAIFRAKNQLHAKPYFS